jgi:hypothetical protein
MQEISVMMSIWAAHRRRASSLSTCIPNSGNVPRISCIQPMNSSNCLSTSACSAKFNSSIKSFRSWRRYSHSPASGNYTTTGMSDQKQLLGKTRRKSAKRMKCRLTPCHTGMIVTVTSRRVRRIAAAVAADSLHIERR